MFNGFYNTITAFDLVSPNHQLTFKNSESHKNFCGFLICLISIAVTFISIREVVFNFIWNVDPDIEEEIDFSDEVLILNNDNFEFYIQFSYWSVETMNSEMLSEEDNVAPPKIMSFERNEKGYGFVYHDIMVPCGTDLIDFYNKGLDKKVNFTEENIPRLVTNSFCMPKNYSFPIIISNDDERHLSISLDSVSFSKLSKKYNFLLMTINYKETVIVPNNYKKPYKKSWDQNMINIKEMTYSYWRLEIQKRDLIIENPTFLIKQEDEPIPIIDTFSIFESISSKYLEEHIGENFFMMNFNINNSPKVVTTRLKYTTFDMVISEFGGTFSVIVFFFEIIFNWLNESLFKAALINSVFKFHIYNDENEKKENKKYSNYKMSKKTFLTEIVNKYIDKYDQIHNKENESQQDNINERGFMTTKNKTVKMKDIEIGFSNTISDLSNQNQ